MELKQISVIPQWVQGKNISDWEVWDQHPAHSVTFKKGVSEEQPCREGREGPTACNGWFCLVFASPHLLALPRKVFLWHLFSGKKDMLTLIWGVASSPLCWHCFSAKSRLPSSHQIPQDQGFYSLPLASASNTDISQLSCCSQSLAQAVTKLVVLKLWDLVASA